jgi:FGGY-family pentulose kinase
VPSNATTPGPGHQAQSRWSSSGDNPSFLVAVDVGSTSARAGVFDSLGYRLARAEHPFSIQRPLPEHAEYRSDEIWDAVTSAVRSAVSTARVPPEQVVGLAFDATCSLAMFDSGGRPVTISTTGLDEWNVVMWADHRAVAEAEEITATGHRVLDYVGGTMSPEMELPKLLWLKRNLPKAWDRYGLALDLADFLSWQASGKLAVSACTVTCKWTYLNHEEHGWQQDLFERIGLADLRSKASLPRKALPIATPIGPLTPAAARELGLSERCVVGVGLIDAHAGGVGLLGSLKPSELNKQLAMIAGTSSCHMAVSPDPRIVPGVWGPYYSAMLPGFWLNEGGQSATGALLDHILDLHAEGRGLGPERHKRVSARIEELLASEGLGISRQLQVLPDFNGNRSPLADAKATGVIHGLTLDGSFDALVRLYYATAVAIALGTRHIVDALNARDYEIGALRLTGGHIGSSLLVRLYADATGCSVFLPVEEDSVLLGTAMVAATAAGVYGSVSAAARAMTRQGARIEPQPHTRPHFEAQYRRFRLMHEHRQELATITA